MPTAGAVGILLPEYLQLEIWTVRFCRATLSSRTSRIDATMTRRRDDLLFSCRDRLKVGGADAPVAIRQQCLGRRMVLRGLTDTGWI